MGAPAGNAGHGKHWGVHRHGDVEHAVHESRIKVDVGGNHLLPFYLVEYLWSQALDGIVEVKLVEPILFDGYLASLLLKHHGTRIGKGVNGMPHPVYLARAVVGLLAENLCQILFDLLLVAPVLHVTLDVVHHGHHLAVGPTVQRPLQRANGCSNGRVGIRLRRRYHVNRERGVVAPLVLGMQHQRQI